MVTKKLNRILNPRAIAIVGASSQEGSVGHSLMKNIVGSGFDGVVYPINPNRSHIMGVKTYSRIGDISDDIDLAIIATPEKKVIQIVEECGQSGLSGIVIVSAGWVGPDHNGQKHLNQILEIIKKYNMRLIGPNSLGFMRPSIHLNASFASRMALPGKIAFISQSGALCSAILDWSVKQNFGFSHFVSIGSMADIGFHDLIDYFGSDPYTNSIVIYMESLTHARSFLSAARAFARNKPIIVLKAGKSKEGSKAALIHTGNPSGDDPVFDAAFRRAGIIRVDTIGELFNSAQSLAMQERPGGRKLAIVTNAGGPGVIATDILIQLHGELAALSNETLKNLNQILPANWSRSNPVDMLGDATPEQYEKSVQFCLDDKNVDGLLIILTPQAMTDPTAVAEKIGNLANPEKKTILAAWMGASDVLEGKRILEMHNIPVYNSPENAVKCFMIMHDYSKILKTLYETPTQIPTAFKPQKEKNKKLIAGILKEGRTSMTEFESKQFLHNYQIGVIKNGLAHNPDEALELATEIGYPLVMKIASPDIIHKTDIGGVRLNIKDGKEVLETYQHIMDVVKNKAPEATISGILVEEMCRRKYELVVRGKRDPIFGPTIEFGMGGLSVEVFRDTTVGLPPLNMALALQLIEDTKVYRLIKGYRGIPGVDISSIQFLLYKFAYILTDFPEILEIDVNPFAVDERGGVALDATIVLDDKTQVDKTNPYKHLVISPYPEQYITEFTMKDGQKAILRPIRPEDEAMEHEMFTKFSERTQKFRFFQSIKDISHEQLIRYTQIDYDREIAIIAEVMEEDRKMMAGVVRLIGDQYNEAAEFAIVIADKWQGLGLGNKFTNYILDIAKVRGIRKVFASAMLDNHTMAHMFRARGFEVRREEDSYYAELDMSKYELTTPITQ